MKEGLPKAAPSVERGREEHLTVKALAFVGFKAKEDANAWLLTAQSIDIAATLSLPSLQSSINLWRQEGYSAGAVIPRVRAPLLSATQNV